VEGGGFWEGGAGRLIWFRGGKGGENGPKGGDVERENANGAGEGTEKGLAVPLHRLCVEKGVVAWKLRMV